MNLSELIVAYRNDHGLSQRQLAAQCNLSTGYISLIEKEINPQTGKRMVPTLQVLNKLAIGMGLSLDELLASCDDMEVNLSAAADLLQDEESLFLSPHERLVLLAYRSHPEAQPFVDKLLGVEPEQQPLSKQA